jgi:hypothetical protein
MAVVDAHGLCCQSRSIWWGGDTFSDLRRVFSETLCSLPKRPGGLVRWGEELGNITGYPGVFQGNSHQYPSKPVPVTMGTG